MPASPEKKNQGLACINAHENRFLREAISLLLTSIYPDIRIAEAGNYEIFLRRAREIEADFVILNYHMASGNNFELIADMRSRGCVAPALIVCDYVEDVVVARAVEYGVRAFIYEGALYTDMKPAVTAVLSGDTFLSKF